MFTPEEEKQYKEILYLLLEKVRATKAAFYVLEPNGGFGLLMHYGFGRTDRFPSRVQRTDPLAQAVYERREPWCVNDIRQAGRLAELMEAASSTRILTSPLYLDGRIVGILDVRDKAGREPFGTEDISWVQEVLRRLAQRLRNSARFSSPVVSPDDEIPFETTTAFGTRVARGKEAPGLPLAGVASDEAPTFETNAHPQARPAPPPAPKPPESGEAPALHLTGGTARTLRLVQEVLAVSEARRTPPPADVPSPREQALLRLFLETCLSLPDVEMAAVSTYSPREAEIVLLSRRPPGEDLEPALIENLEKIFARAGARFPMPDRRKFRADMLPGTGGAPMGRAEIAAIQSSVLSAGTDAVVLLSLVFRQGPGAEEHEGLKHVHLVVKNALEEVRSGGRYREAYRGLVNKLLEPGLRRYGGLKAHSFAVARMARRFASTLKLSAVELEQITVAAILHDVGMRDLNYDEIYAKRSLSEEELALVREHPRVGASLLEEVTWPYPVPPLVRHHHERWDGAGYPDGLRAEQIPLGSRLIHICEAFDAMTSPTSYRAVLSLEQALEIIASKGGTQFDPELAPAFKRMLEGLKGAL